MNGQLLAIGALALLICASVAPAVAAPGTDGSEHAQPLDAPPKTRQVILNVFGMT